MSNIPLRTAGGLGCPREGLTGERPISAEQVIDERAEAKAPDCEARARLPKRLPQPRTPQAESGMNQQKSFGFGNREMGAPTLLIDRFREIGELRYVRMRTSFEE